MTELGFSGKRQDRRKGSFHTFLWVAYHALGDRQQIAPTEVELRAWMDEFVPDDEDSAVDVMEDAFRAVDALATGVRAEGTCYHKCKPLSSRDKVSLALTCSVLTLSEESPELAGLLEDEPFLIPASDSGAATRSTASKELVAAFRVHVDRVLDDAAFQDAVDEPV